MTSFELMFGRNTRLPVDLQTGTSFPKPEGSTAFVKQLRETEAIAKELVDAHVAVSQHRQKKNYNCKTSLHHSYSRGDLIWLYTPIVGTDKFSKLATLESSFSCHDSR